MELIAIKTPRLPKGEKIYSILLKLLKPRLKNGDILVIASKIISLYQNRVVKAKEVKISHKAKKVAKKYQLNPALVVLIFREADKIIGGTKGALLTLNKGFLAPNAGIDQSNVPKGEIILWPKNITKEADILRKLIFKKLNKKIGVIINDSHCQPTRLGTVSQALAISGFEGVKDFRQKKDIYGRKLQITQQNIADSLSSAANILMGEASERKPLVIIRNLNLKFSHKSSAVLTKKLLIKSSLCLYNETGLYNSKNLG